MDNVVLFSILAALIALVLIPVVLLGGFSKKERRATEEPEIGKNEGSEEDADPLDEYERTGIMHFDPDAEAESGEAKPRKGLE